MERQATRPWAVLALAAGAGLAGGVLTLYGQRLLAGSGGWFALVNSVAPWVTVAFLVGMRAPGRWRTAAVAGAVAEAGLVLGYYLSAGGFSFGSTSMLIWFVTGLIAGPVYGAAGALWRDRRRPVRSAALGVLGAAWVADGLRDLWLATSHSGPGTTAGRCVIAFGVLLTVFLGRSVRDRVFGLAALAGGTAAVVVAGVVVDRVFLL